MENNSHESTPPSTINLSAIANLDRRQLQDKPRRMVGSDVNKISYAITSGSVSAQPITFRYDDDNWINAVFYDPATLTETPLTRGIDYGLSGNGATINGSLTLSAPFLASIISGNLIIYRVAPNLQNTDLSYNDRQPSELLERSLDRQAMASQDRDVTNGNPGASALLFPISEPGGNKTRFSSPALRAGTIPAFDDFTGELVELPTRDLALKVLATYGLGISSQDVLSSISELAPIIGYTPPTSLTPGKPGQLFIIPKHNNVIISGTLTPDITGELQAWKTGGDSIQKLWYSSGGVDPTTRTDEAVSITLTFTNIWVITFYAYGVLDVTKRFIGLNGQASPTPDACTSWINVGTTGQPVITLTDIIPSLTWRNQAPEGMAPDWQPDFIIGQSRTIRFSEAGIYSDTDLRESVTTTGVDQSEAIQAIFDKSEDAPLHVIVDVACTGYADIGDNTTVDILGGCGIKLPDSSNRPLFRNKNWASLTIPAASDPTEQIAYEAFMAAIVKNKNITIQGDGILHYNATNNLHDTFEGGWVVGMRFFHVENLTIKGDLKHYRPKTFTIETGNTINLRIESSNMDVGAAGGLNMDGIHVHGPFRDVVIKGCSGFFDDDAASIVPNDGDFAADIGNPDYTFVPYGDGTGVLIDDFNLRASLYGFRLASSSNILDDVVIRNIRGSFSKAGVVADYIPEAILMGPQDGGKFGNIIVQDWFARPINSMGAKGAIFFIGGTHKRWTFRNIERHDLLATNFDAATWKIKKEFPSNPLANCNVDYIDIDGYSMSKPTTGGFQHTRSHLNIDAANVGRASIRHTIIDLQPEETIAGFLVAVLNGSVVDSLEIDGLTSGGRLGGILVSDSTSEIKSLTIKNINEPMFSNGAIAASATNVTISGKNPQDFSVGNFNNPSPGYGDALFRLFDVYGQDVSIEGIFSISAFGTMFLGLRELGYAFNSTRTGISFKVDADEAAIIYSETGVVLDTVAFTPSANTEYFLQFTAVGDDYNGYIRRDNGDWLSAAGAWQTAKVACCSVTNSTKSGRNIFIGVSGSGSTTINCRNVEVKQI